MAQVNHLNTYNSSLEKSLGELEAKVKAYQGIMLKYESIFREEILLYRLEKSKLTAVQEAFQGYELFAKEIEQQISIFLTDFSPGNNQPNKISTFKRILLRFFHQNRLNHSSTDKKLNDIDNLINQKQQMLERFHTDIKNWKKKLRVSLPSSNSQPMQLKQAVSL